MHNHESACSALGELGNAQGFPFLAFLDANRIPSCRPLRCVIFIFIVSLLLIPSMITAHTVPVLPPAFHAPCWVSLVSPSAGSPAPAQFICKLMINVFHFDAGQRHVEDFSTTISSNYILLGRPALPHSSRACSYYQINYFNRVMMARASLRWISSTRKTDTLLLDWGTITPASAEPFL